jgi:hypothetical protein
MTPELWQRLKPLFHEAMELPNGERSRFIAEACGNDDELREELAALLKAKDEPTSRGDAPIVNLEGLFAKPSKTFSPGELVLGRFKIVRAIGSGGMGDVYEAMDLELGRIALKTIRSDTADSPEILSRFKKEVQLARKVSNSHICRVHELFVIPGPKGGIDRAFLTMEFLDGITLSDKVRQSGPLLWKDARTIGIQICAGLQAIHEAGIIHRDLKSRNIMLASRNGSTCVVLMDFGENAGVRIGHILCDLCSFCQPLFAGSNSTRSIRGDRNRSRRGPIVCPNGPREVQVECAPFGLVLAHR